MSKALPLAGLVSNMSREQRILFFLHCGLPDEEEWSVLKQLGALWDTKRVALLYDVDIHDAVFPTEKAAHRYSEISENYLWYGLDDTDRTAIDPHATKSVIDCWEHLAPWDPALVQVVEELGESLVSNEGRYQLLEVPAVFSYEVIIGHYMQSEYSATWYQYLTLSGIPMWVPPLQ